MLSGVRCEVAMEQLVSSPSLSAFFNEFLSEEVFAVKLIFQHGSILEVGGSLLPEKQDQLLSWCEEHRWKYFTRSGLFNEHKLWSLMTHHSALNKSTSLSPTCQPPHQVNLQTDWSADSRQEQKNSDITEYKHLRGFLAGTHGEAMLSLWTSLEEWQTMGPERRWTELRKVREQCSLLPGLSKYTCGGPVDTCEWVEALKKECEDRLTNYWLPRFQHKGQRVPTLSAGMSCDLSGDPNEPFVNGLRCNQRSGRPFEEYLSSCGGRHFIPLVKFWEALDWVLLTQHSRGDKVVVREVWRLWSEYVDQSDDCCAEVLGDNKADLLRSLKDSNRSSLVQTLSLIQTDVLSTLKRTWTGYLRHDFQLFHWHVGSIPLSLDGPSPAHKSKSLKPRNRKKEKPSKQSDILTFDLKGTPLEPLQDFETVLHFEQYLLTSCGPHSQFLLNYQLWRALTKLSQSVDPQSRDALALYIYRRFLSQEAKRSVRLPHSLLEQLETGSEVTRPSSPILSALTQFSSRLLEVSVNRFRGEGPAGSEEEGGQSDLWTLPPIDGTNKPQGSKSSSAVRGRSKFQHLVHTLERCEGPISHQLSSFSDFLEQQCPPTQQKQLTNNVLFWLEVHKFKIMFESHTGPRVLCHKAEALVDRYLDTTTLPWVKVTVPSDLASRTVSAVCDLRKSGGWPLLEHVHQLLVRAQEVALNDMVPYWPQFCAQYTSPTGSSIAIPQAAPCTPPSSRRPSLSLPPIVRVTAHTPLLSYSSLKGLKWKTGFP